MAKRKDAAKRRPDYDPGLRERAHEAYKQEGSYRAAGEKLGISSTRVFNLVKEYQRERRRRSR